MTVHVTLVETEGALADVAARAARADRIAVDAESSGLHTYHAGLCVLQLAWPEGDGMAIAVVDAPAAGVAALAPLLARGPVKVLHDLTFDARLLAGAGAPLGGPVRDTSVAARLLGFAATGLASLLASELSVEVSKRFQQHDWSRRPITAEQLDYLAGDVRHLLALDDHLARLADARDVGPEIAEECAHKLVVALAPPRDPRPGYVRVKGAAALDPEGRAVLRRLWLAREAAAESLDVPPFKVAPHDLLVTLAAKRPATREALDALALPGVQSGRVASLVKTWLGAIAEGVRDADLPEAERTFFTPPPPDRDALARRRARETAVNAWRRAEAKRRQIDEQAVLPGHCAEAVVSALVAHESDPAALRDAIARIPGFGARRCERYLDALAALAAPGPPARG